MKGLSAYDIKRRHPKLKLGTIYKRLRSPNAEKRWGVRKVEAPDGTFRYRVSEYAFKTKWKPILHAPPGRGIKGMGKDKANKDGNSQV